MNDHDAKDPSDPFAGARGGSFIPKYGDPRLGTPPDKFGMMATPIRTADRRQAVMLMLFPPEELRDAPLPVIERVIAGQAQGLLKSIAVEIYKSYTSEPLDAAGARNVADALARHADSLSQPDGKRGGE